MLKDQLIEVLSKLPGNPQIILSSDAEGNEFAELSGYSVEYVNEDFPEDYEVSIFNEDDIRDDYDGEIPDNFAPVLVLWPV
jgi:hypothetical protein